MVLGSAAPRECASKSRSTRLRRAALAFLLRFCSLAARPFGRLSWPSLSSSSLSSSLSLTSLFLGRTALRPAILAVIVVVVAVVVVVSCAQCVGVGSLAVALRFLVAVRVPVVAAIRGKDILAQVV